MRIHTYTAGVEAAVTHPDVASDVQLRVLLVVEAEEQVFRVGDDVEVDVELTVGELFGADPGHVVAHHCRKITMTASYAGQDRIITVHPAVHVKQARAKAIEEFKLDAASSADLVLRLPGSSNDMVETNPLGAYVPKGTCSLTVDLVHQVRAQG